MRIYFDFRVILQLCTQETEGRTEESQEEDVEFCPACAREVTKENRIEFEHNDKVYSVCSVICVEDVKMVHERYLEELGEIEDLRSEIDSVRFQEIEDNRE